MSFATAIKTCFRRYATFNGRARRSEFWWFYLFTVIVSMAFFAVLVSIGLGSGMASSDPDTASLGGGLAFTLVNVLSFVVSLALLVPSLAVMWRRLHDTDRSGLWWFIGLIPLIGGIVLIVFWAQDSTRGPNRFGPSPEDVGPRTGPVSGDHGISAQGYGTSA